MPFSSFGELFYKRVEQMNNACLLHSGSRLHSIVLEPQAFDTLAYALGRKMDATELDLYVTGGLVLVRKVGT